MIMNSINHEKRIRDICIYENGNSYEEFVNSDGNYKLISLNSIDIDGNLKNNMKKIAVNNPKTLLKNDIVMVLSDVAHGDFLGISAIIPESNEYVLNQRMGLLRIFDGSNPKFIVNAINSNQKQFKVLGQGSSQLNLSKDDILNAIIKYPDIKTQVKYGIVFDNINKSIYLNENKLSELVQLKKGLMQNMFV